MKLNIYDLTMTDEEKRSFADQAQRQEIARLNERCERLSRDIRAQARINMILVERLDASRQSPSHYMTEDGRVFSAEPRITIVAPNESYAQHIRTLNNEDPRIEIVSTTTFASFSSPMGEIVILHPEVEPEQDVNGEGTIATLIRARQIGSNPVIVRTE